MDTRPQISTEMKRRELAKAGGDLLCSPIYFTALNRQILLKQSVKMNVEQNENYRPEHDGINKFGRSAQTRIFRFRTGH